MFLAVRVLGFRVLGFRILGFRILAVGFLGLGIWGLGLYGDKRLYAVQCSIITHERYGSWTGLGV